VIVDHCAPTGGNVEINLCFFTNILHSGHGAAICVADSVVSLRSNAFLSCSVGPTTDSEGRGYRGACACLDGLQSGSDVIDSCATKCVSYAGSFVACTSRADFE
jgi:hypothetical protein